MGQQQLLLIIIAAIIVAIGISVGVALFGSTNVSSNKDAIINDLANIATNANSYRMRPSIMAGGSGLYSGYSIPGKLQSNENGSYTAVVAPSSIILTGTSAEGFGAVQVVLDSTGQLTSYTYSGEFQ